MPSSDATIPRPVVSGQSDLPRLARAQLRTIQAQALAANTTATTAVLKAHRADVADRVAEILEAKK
jgi:hypothetical protein